MQLCCHLTMLATYSLIKMLYWVVRKNCDAGDGRTTGLYLTESQLTQAVRRNFGGSDEFDPLDEFEDCLQSDILEEVCMYINQVIVFLIVFLTRHIGHVCVYIASAIPISLLQISSNSISTPNY